MDLSCPKCKSENTQKITSVVSSGTTHTTGTTSSTSVGTTGTTVGVSTSRGTVSATSTTDLARKLAEPTKKYEGFIRVLLCAFLFILPVSLVIGGYVAYEILWFEMDPWAKFHTAGWVFGIIPFFWLMNLVYKKWEPYRMARKAYNQNEFPELHKRWSEGFYCHRCENIFVP